MRFLVDVCMGPAVAKWLRQQGYEVFSVYEQARGIDDLVEKSEHREPNFDYKR